MADLYDNLAMPPELRKAHNANDKAVLNAYDISSNTSDNDIVPDLFSMYEKMIN